MSIVGVFSGMNGIKDHIGIISALAVLVLLCVAAKITQFYGFALNDYDTGIYGNVAWNLAHGEGFHSDVLNVSHLSVHFSPLIAIFAPFYALFPTPMVLMIGQGAAAGLTLLILYRIGMHLLDATALKERRPWIILGFCFLAFCYGPFTNALLSHFHPPTVAMPILAGCLLALIERRHWLLVLLVPLLLTAKENAPLAVVGLGIYAALVQGRWPLGLALGVIGVTTLALVLFLIMPAFQDGAWVLAGRFEPLALLDKKLLYLLLLVLPLAFLPLFAWRAATAALPLIAVNLAVGYEAQLELKYHYNDLASVFLLVAAMQGLNQLFAGPGRSVLPNAKPAHALALAIVLALAINKGRNPITDLVKHWPTADHWALHQELAPYRKSPPDQAILAQSGLGPYLSSRYRYVMLRSTWKDDDLRPGDLILLSDHAGDYLVDIEAARARLDALSHVETVEKSELLTVYKVRPRAGDSRASLITEP
jgi:uncharacterized membrane protein